MSVPNVRKSSVSKEKDKDKDPVNKEKDMAKKEKDKCEIDKFNVCPECQKEVEGSDQGVNCETCGNWFHTQCQNISAKEYENMKNVESKILHWFCSGCEKEILTVGKVIYTLRTKQEKFESDLVALKA